VSQDPAFSLQRERFLRTPKGDLLRYAGAFAPAKDGQIVDHDNDLSALTRRSVERFGNDPVYITKVGGDFEASIDTPFLE
jgi:hypothetical protein